MSAARMWVIAVLCAGCGQGASNDMSEAVENAAGQDASGDDDLPSVCDPGDTRECVGMGACKGGQRCDDDGRWGFCDCRMLAEGAAGANAAPGVVVTSTSPAVGVPIAATPGLVPGDPIAMSPGTMGVTPAPMGSGVGGPGPAATALPGTPVAPNVPAPGTVVPGPPSPPPATPPSEFPTCDSVSYIEANGSADVPALDGVQEVFFFGDDETTACSDLTMSGMACMYGEAPGSGDDYSAWGAGMGLQLAPLDDGNVIAPFNAAALGITGFRVTLSNVAARPLRIAIAQVDDPSITDAGANYQNNGFLWGGSRSTEVTTDGIITASFAEFTLPEWTQLTPDQELDPSQLHSLQFQIVNGPSDVLESYSFCISTFAWLDAAGNVVDAPEPASTAAAPSATAPAGTAGTVPVGLLPAGTGGTSG